MHYYAYRFAIRSADTFSSLHRVSKLFQQFVIDAFEVEADRFHFLRTHHQQLRIADYANLEDYVNVNEEQRGLRAGNIVILPSTHPGSPRNMHHL